MMECLRCHTALPADLVNTDRFERCPSCGARVRADLFPAAGREGTSQAPTPMVEGEGAGCFYHPDKAAVAPCGSCGRFLCSLCDVEMSPGEHICFTCLEAGKNKKKRVDLEHHRTLYDSIALRLATVPLLIFWFTLITAPAALYVAIRYYNAPTSIIPRTRIRYHIAGLLALVQIGLWAYALYVFAT